MTFQAIKKHEITFPDEMTAESKNLIESLLIADPDARLGAQGFDALKSHAFFNGIDWNALSTTTPPKIV